MELVLSFPACYSPLRLLVTPTARFICALSVREHLDIDAEGGTEPDNYERAVEGNRQFRIEMVRQAEVGHQEVC